MAGGLFLSACLDFPCGIPEVRSFQEDRLLLPGPHQILIPSTSDRKLSLNRGYSGEYYTLRIAYLEDDPDQAKLVKHWLEESGHHVSSYQSGKELVRALRTESFDLLILDWMIPDMSGMEVLDWTRSHYDWNIPILFCTQRNREEDIVRALEAGADDYMEKPITPKELIARISALQRRTQLGLNNSQSLDFAPYTIDLASRAISLHGEWIELTQKEYDLAVFMFKNLGRAISRGHILDTVWGMSPELNTRTVDTHVSRLRKKLQLNQGTGWALSSIYQHGYRLDQVKSNDDNTSGQA
jgi:DNA-binding response OmpR family regulator